MNLGQYNGNNQKPHPRDTHLEVHSLSHPLQVYAIFLQLDSGLFALLQSIINVHQKMSAGHERDAL